MEYIDQDMIPFAIRSQYDFQSRGCRSASYVIPVPLDGTNITALQDTSRAANVFSELGQHFRAVRGDSGKASKYYRVIIPVQSRGFFPTRIGVGNT
jgi:hypothetical protein